MIIEIIQDLEKQATSPDAKQAEAAKEQLEKLLRDPNLSAPAHFDKPQERSRTLNQLNLDQYPKYLDRQPIELEHILNSLKQKDKAERYTAVGIEGNILQVTSRAAKEDIQNWVKVSVALAAEELLDADLCLKSEIKHQLKLDDKTIDSKGVEALMKSLVMCITAACQGILEQKYKAKPDVFAEVVMGEPSSALRTTISSSYGPEVFAFMERKYKPLLNKTTDEILKERIIPRVVSQIKESKISSKVVPMLVSALENDMRFYNRNLANVDASYRLQRQAKIKFWIGLVSGLTEIQRPTTHHLDLFYQLWNQFLRRFDSTESRYFQTDANLRDQYKACREFAHDHRNDLSGEFLKKEPATEKKSSAEEESLLKNLNNGIQLRNNLLAVDEIEAHYWKVQNKEKNPNREVRKKELDLLRDLQRIRLPANLYTIRSAETHALTECMSRGIGDGLLARVIMEYRERESALARIASEAESAKRQEKVSLNAKYNPQYFASEPAANQKKEAPAAKTTAPRRPAGSGRG